MKFFHTPLIDKNNYQDESPEMESRRVWRHRRSVKVFPSRQHHQDTLRCFESMLRGMYAFNHKLADMDRGRHNRIAWHKYGNFVVEKERFPTLPSPLFPDRYACIPRDPIDGLLIQLQRAIPARQACSQETNKRSARSSEEENSGFAYVQERFRGGSGWLEGYVRFRSCEGAKIRSSIEEFGVDNRKYYAA